MQLQNLARQMQAQLGGANLPASLMQLFEGQLKPQVNNQLISQAQIVNFAENNDIFVGSDIIFNMLQKILTSKQMENLIKINTFLF